MSEVMVRNGQRIDIAPNYVELCDLANDYIRDIIGQYYAPTILFPEGSTQQGVKSGLVKTLASTSKLINICNLDEYCVSDGNGGHKLIDAKDPQSFRGNIRKGFQ